MWVSDESLGRAVQHDVTDEDLAFRDPVARAVVDDLAEAMDTHVTHLREAGAVLLEAIGAGDSEGVRLHLRTAMATLSAVERRGHEDPHASLRGLTDEDPLLRLLVDALVRHRPEGGGVRPEAEARDVASLLCTLIYMFRAQREAARLAARIG